MRRFLASLISLAMLLLSLPAWGEEILIPSEDAQLSDSQPLSVSAPSSDMKADETEPDTLAGDSLAPSADPSAEAEALPGNAAATSAGTAEQVLFAAEPASEAVESAVLADQAEAIALPGDGNGPLTEDEIPEAAGAAQDVSEPSSSPENAYPPEAAGAEAPAQDQAEASPDLPESPLAEEEMNPSPAGEAEIPAQGQAEASPDLPESPLAEEEINPSGTEETEAPAQGRTDASPDLPESPFTEDDKAPSGAGDVLPERGEAEASPALKLFRSASPLQAGSPAPDETASGQNTVQDGRPEGVNPDATASGQNTVQQDGSSRTVRIAILSDLHYVTDQLLNQSNWDMINTAALSESRLLEEVDAVLSGALRGAADYRPDAMVVCGDLVSNGELLGARALADKLKEAKQQDGLTNTGIYVVNGNHDINNSYAADFTGEAVGNAKRVQPEEFAEVFAGLGYGADDHWAGGTHSVYVPTDDPSKIANHGGLSYASEIAEGVTLIVLDTAVYRVDGEEKDSWYNEAQRTAGFVSDDLLQWAKTQAETAKANGNLVLAMCHQAMVPHYERELEEDVNWYMKETMISNWEQVAGTLADAGVTAVLTGHSHTNDIAKFVSENNNVIYDIETASLAAYPLAWRTMEITISGEGDEQTYGFSINTSRVDTAPEGTDTSTWRFVIGGESRTFEEDYEGSLLDYAYDKTGITEPMVGPAAGYLLKSYLYDMVNHEGGLGGYIQEMAGLEEGQTLGDLVISSVSKMQDSLSSITKDFTFLNTTVTLKTGRMENVPDADATDEQLAQNMPSLDISLDLGSTHEEAKISLDLSYIRTAVGEFMEKLQKTLSEGAWMKNPYASTPLVDDIASLVSNAILPAMTKSMVEDGADPAYDTPLKMINDAWQSDAYGDEGLADEETVQRWEKERELLMSEKLGSDLVDGFMSQLSQVPLKYSSIKELMDSQRVVSEEKTSLVRLDAKEGSDSTYLNTISSVLGLNSFSTLGSVFQPLTLLTTFGIKLPGTLAKPIQEKVAALHQTKTMDTNIPHDNQWDFHTVNFNANGGSVRQKSAATVEGGRLASLPLPDARSGYTFAGWFTDPEGGEPVSLENDLSGISTLYAHWTYTEKPEEEINPTEPGAEPASSPVSAAGRSSAGPSARKKNPADLHVRFFGSVPSAHSRIRSVVDDPAFLAFCEQFASRLIRNPEGLFEVDMGSWLLLDAHAVEALQACGSDVAITFTCQGERFRFILPAGFDLISLADENGCVCVLCLASAV